MRFVIKDEEQDEPIEVSLEEDAGDVDIYCNDKKIGFFSEDGALVIMEISLNSLDIKLELV
jgi:hypothetical protein